MGKVEMNKCLTSILIFCAVLNVYVLRWIVNETKSKENKQVELESKTFEFPKEVAIDYSKTKIDDEETLLDPYPNEPFPRVAWLMTFPHSGTTYTISLVRQITQ